MTPKAVGIQMKLEFFQRKFWTASRQVSTEIYVHENIKIYIYQTRPSTDVLNVYYYLLHNSSVYEK